MGRNVLRMDHYCPWLSNCIGHYNHKYFVLFLLYTTLTSNMIVYGAFKVSAAHSIKLNAGAQLVLAEGSALAAVLSALLNPFLGFHCWLLSKNVTTLEFCEKQSNRKGKTVNITEDPTDVWSSLLASKSERSWYQLESPYDINLYHNLKSVLGKNVFTWFLPFSGGQESGLHFPVRAELPFVREHNERQGLGLEKTVSEINPEMAGAEDGLISSSSEKDGKKEVSENYHDYMDAFLDSGDSSDPLSRSRNAPEETQLEAPPPRIIYAKTSKAPR